MRYLVLIFFFFTLNLSAQTFQRSYDYCDGATNTVDGSGKYVAEVEDGYLIFTQNFYNCFTVEKLDYDGEVIDTKEFDFSPNFFYSRHSGFLKDKNGDFLITGLMGKGILTNRDVGLLKISGKTLDTLWTKRYYLEDYQTPAAIRRTGDNEFTILAEMDSVIVSADSTRFYSLKAELLFMKIDTLGNLIDRIFVNGISALKSIPGDFHHLPSGEIIVAYGNDQSGFPPDATRSLLDSNYNEIWSERFGESPFGSRAVMPQIVVSPDSSVIYNTWIVTAFFDKPGGSGFIQAFTKENELLWELCLRGSTFWITSLSITEDGFLYGSGYDYGVTEVYDGVDEDDDTDRGRIFMISPEGEVVFDHRYKLNSLPEHDPDGRSYLRDVIQTSDGGFLATGGINPPISSPRNDFTDVYVLKLDSNGCLVPDCDSIVFSVPQYTSVEENNLQNQLNLYPNPTSETINITFNPALGEVNFSLFSLTGKKVHETKSLRSGNQVNIAHLLKGIYFYQLQSTDPAPMGNRRVGSGRVVVQ